jgi:hypothetical protein
MIVASPRNCFLIAALVATGMARGETINWYSPAQKTNLTSTGLVMDGGFQFQLGVFSGSFVPTPGNASQWATWWASAQAASYNPASKAFDSLFTVTGNTAPFSVGAKAYVWGRRTASTGDEWILFRKNDWTWPAPDPMNPFFTDWNAASANEVILGSINANGLPYLMKSEAVYSYSQWRDSTLAGEPLNGPNDDPDRDGVSNLLEFVFETPPTLAGASPLTATSFVEISGQSYLQISIPRLRNRLAKLTVEVSADLSHWDSGDSFTAVVADSVTTLVVRDKTPAVPGAAKRFMRIKAELQP